MSNPNAHHEHHVKMVKYFCRYFQSQRRSGVSFNPDEDKGLYIFSDTGFDTDIFTGNTAIFGGGTVASTCSRQKFKSLHSMEAEMAGMNEAAKLAIYLQAICLDLGEKIGTVTIFGDNQAAVSTSWTPVLEDMSIPPTL